MTRFYVILATLVLTIVLTSTYNATKIAAQSGTDFRVDSQITNSISGLVIIRNRTNDYSLKAISGDGTKDVTLIRFAGTSAEADISVVYHLFAKIFEVLGVRP